MSKGKGKSYTRNARETLGAILEGIAKYNNEHPSGRRDLGTSNAIRQAIANAEGDTIEDVLAYLDDCAEFSFDSHDKAREREFEEAAAMLRAAYYLGICE